MDMRENNRMSMYRAVDAVLGQHEAAIAKIQVLAKAVLRFRESMKALAVWDVEYQAIAAGATAAKNSSSEILAAHTLRIANALYVFGWKTDNEQIKAECCLTASELNAMDDRYFQRLCERIAGIVNEHRENLIPFGILTADIESFDKVREIFVLKLDEHQRRQVESKVARDMLYGEFNGTDEILKEELDRLMELTRERDVEFYYRYRAARVMKDHNGHSAKNRTPKDAEIASDTPATEPIEEPATV